MFRVRSRRSAACTFYGTGNFENSYGNVGESAAVNSDHCIPCGDTTGFDYDASVKEAHTSQTDCLCPGGYSGPPQASGVCADCQVHTFKVGFQDISCANCADTQGLYYTNVYEECGKCGLLDTAGGTDHQVV